MAKAVVERIEDVPEALRGEYKQDGAGKWVLQLDGDHPSVAAVIADANAKVGEFRGNNISLMKERDALLEKMKAFDGVDPAKYRELQVKITDLEKRGVNKADDVAALVQKAVADAVNPIKADLDSEKQARAEATSKLGQARLRETLTSVGLHAGVEERAIPDFVTRGLEVWAANGDKIEPKTPVYSKKHPGELITPGEWAEGLQAEAPHLYKPTKGAGTDNGDGRGRTGTAVFEAGPDGTLGKDFLANLDDIASGKVVRKQ